MCLKILAILTKISEIFSVTDKHGSLYLRLLLQNALKFVHNGFNKSSKNHLHTFKNVLLYNYRCNSFLW